MLGLHAQPIEGQDFLICRTNKMPKYSRWQLKLSIDDGPTLNGGSVDFLESDAPSAEFFYPQAAAPARNRGKWDYDGEFWTSWYNLDTPSDDVEDESFAKVRI
jgi:hypothetical protein